MDRVKVGDIIRFYHKEMEAYLVAEGLFDDELLEDGNIITNSSRSHIRRLQFNSILSLSLIIHETY